MMIHGADQFNRSAGNCNQAMLEETRLGAKPFRRSILKDPFFIFGFPIVPESDLLPVSDREPRYFSGSRRDVD